MFAPIPLESSGECQRILHTMQHLEMIREEQLLVREPQLQQPRAVASRAEYSP